MLININDINDRKAEAEQKIQELEKEKQIYLWKIDNLICQIKDSPDIRIPQEIADLKRAKLEIQESIKKEQDHVKAKWCKLKDAGAGALLGSMMGATIGLAIIFGGKLLKFPVFDHRKPGEFDKLILIFGSIIGVAVIVGLLIGATMGACQKSIITAEIKDNKKKIEVIDGQI